MVRVHLQSAAVDCWQLTFRGILISSVFSDILKNSERVATHIKFSRQTRTMPARELLFQRLFLCIHKALSAGFTVPSQILETQRFQLKARKVQFKEQAEAPSD